MNELERITNILKGQDPATLSPDILTKEEWGVLEEYYNEQAIKAANMESIIKWVKLTNILPNGLLSPSEKVEIIKLVMSRIPSDLKSCQ